MRDKVAKVYALEPNPGMIRRAEEQRRRAKLDIEFLDLPDERVPLPDIARAHELVEHPTRPGRVIVTI